MASEEVEAEIEFSEGELLGECLGAAVRGLENGVQELGSALAAECDHEWEVFDESFDHEYGRETDICEMCIRCGLERGTFGSAAWDHLAVIHDGAQKAVKAGSNPARSIVTPHLPWVEPEEDGCVQQKVSSELQS